MKTIRTLPEFAGLSELEIQSALDAYDAACEENGGEISDPGTVNPIAGEFFRLVDAYTERFDELTASAADANSDPEKVLEDIFNYEPGNAIEQEAFDFFTGVFEDALRDMDDGSEE